ncbi:TAXI family TRAP transporter solute-binding subunit [uncultured Marinobacter sp.]|jgi:uncharacterized protein|uniref:TAXI family TRAP transporter solute-binding subunit n=1 Tax=uncultured Marinobacter sp. TaxID=187379 RepID=UPI0030C8353D|tara:strand:+ start:781 stop:1788 length:1008 start_codon:yes stop_codon:yes gene_type:complete
MPKIKSSFVKNILVGLALTSTAATANAQFLVMGGNPAGSLFYTQAQALATTISNHTGYRIDVLPQSGSVFFPMFQTQEADIGIASPVEAKLAYDAEGPFDGANGGDGYSMRTLMLGSVNRLSLVTREDDDINSIEELRDRRVVANYGAFAGSTKTALAALASAGLTEDDVDVVPVSSYPEGVRAVIEGRADAAVGSVGSGILQELDAAHGARLLPIHTDKAAVKRLQEVGPAFVPLEVDAGPVGIAERTPVLSYQTTLYTRPDLDEQVIQNIMEALWNNADELPAITRTLSTWQPDNYANTDVVIPFHPAAIEFYKEKGVWTDELQARQDELLNH